MKYHLDPFTPETWELFREAGATVIGEEEVKLRIG